MRKQLGVKAIARVNTCSQVIFFVVYLVEQLYQLKPVDLIRRCQFLHGLYYSILNQRIFSYILVKTLSWRMKWSDAGAPACLATATSTQGQIYQ